VSSKPSKTILVLGFYFFFELFDPLSFEPLEAFLSFFPFSLDAFLAGEGFAFVFGALSFVPDRGELVFFGNVGLKGCDDGRPTD
jgi:hypothetical protein